MKRFWYLRRGPKALRHDVEEELRVHLEMRIEELKAQGFSDEDARQEALIRFGDFDGTRRYCHRQDVEKENNVQRALLLADLLQDVRLSLRNLLRAPMLTLTIIATVGLGLGATTTIFSAVYAALLQPLPYADPERLVRIYTDNPPFKFRFSVADYQAFETQQTHFERVAGYTDRALAFSDGSTAERVRGRVVTWTYFSVLGIRPTLGRDFLESESRPGTSPAVILSDAFWRQRLGARTDIVGTAIRLDGIPHTVAGVLPPTLGPLEQRQDFFIAAQWPTPPRRGPFFITPIARFKADTDRAAAAAELRAINRRIFPIWKSSYQDDRATWSMMDLKAHVVGDAGTTAGLALAAVVLVWLIATVNASNLLVARVTSRRRELAVRAALGASRARVVRYLLAESALLATGAAAIGAGLSWLGIGLLRGIGAAYFPRTHEIALDGPVLAVLLAATFLSALLFGLIPALHGTGGAVDESLRSIGRSATGSLAVRRLRRALVASQFAIATPLLVVAALLLGSLNELRRVDIGFDSRNTLTGGIQLPAAQYGDDARVVVFWDELKRRLAAVPGVTGLAFADGRPPIDVGNFNNFDLEDRPAQGGQSQPVTPWVRVSPEYFGVLGLTLLEGRLLDERDANPDGVVAVVVDRAWANRFFPGASAVGRRFREGGCTQCEWTTVVGVVSSVKYAGLDKPDEGTVYWLMGPSRFRYVVLRTGADSAAMLPAIRDVVRTLDPTLPLSNVATIDDLVARSLEASRSLSLLVAAFAAVALVLSTVGIYGVMAYYVQQHAKDISIRLALGGRPADVLRLVLGQGMKVVAAGIVIGIVAAFALTRFISNLLFGVSANDAVTLAGTAAFLLTVALAACFVPARRAVLLEPAAVLRDE